jgi:peptide deformylase
MIQNIIRTTDPRIRTKSKPIVKVDKKINQLIKDLKETLKKQLDPEGVGLAAPQIGKNIQVFVMLEGNNIKTVINPKIIKVSTVLKNPKNKMGRTIMEGCLSLPHFYGPIKRSQEITLEYLDEEGKTKTENFTGLSAQIVQHEIDHLNGIVFVDRLLEQKKPLYEYKHGEWEKVEL